jgi:GxxExxY protein
VATEVSVPVIYRNVTLKPVLRIDMLVNDCVIAELKAVETLLPVHHAQLLSYLRLADVRVGLLINFNVPRLILGVKRIVNRY